MLQRSLIEIKGQVQGVGFRPFVYRLAIQLGLSGWVINDACGVRIDIQGDSESIALFFNQLYEQLPPLARIDSLQCHSADPAVRQGFSILASEQTGSASVAIAPDQGICDDCRRELFDPTSRFYRYPFINCTNCGPRFTIIKGLPYDRPQTSMAQFSLCESCNAAYLDPCDRRYHAQPISCVECGPSVSLFDGFGQVTNTHEDAMITTAKLIASGGVVAIKGLGGFHLACDAANIDAVAKLRVLKRRARKPLAVMMASEEVAQHRVLGNDLEWQTLVSQAKPIVLMKKRSHSDIARNVAPNVPYLGVMLPYTPLHLLLMDELKTLNASQALIMTSANLSGLPIAIERQQVLNAFDEGLAGVLDHNRAIVNPCDDSLMQYAGGEMRMLRLARGYAPLSFALNEQLSDSVTSMVAAGAQQKSSVALATRDLWLLSSYLGDIDDLDTQNRYQEMYTLLTELYHTSPSHWIADKHPNYFSTQYAEQQGEDAVLKIQHHYAHILAVMAEHDLTGPVLGFAFDGTGMGDDRSIWGGEVLLADALCYQRVAHLRPFKLIGGEQAIREPQRILYALLLEWLTPAQIMALDIKAFHYWSEARFINLWQLWKSSSCSSTCTSVGRLFDAWACLLELIDKPDFEGECGLAMENAAAACPNHKFELGFEWRDNGELDWQSALERSLSAQVESGESWSAIVSDAFIRALAVAIRSLAERYPDLPVVLGGGVFQNRRLLDELASIYPSNLIAFQTGSRIPVSDGGIAAGQLWHMLAKLRQLSGPQSLRENTTEFAAEFN